MVSLNLAALGQDPLPTDPSTMAKPTGNPLSTIAASFMAHLILLIVAVTNVFSLAPHSDNLWQLNLVRQFRENSRFAVTFVDANRIFPDLLIATSLERAWSGAGSNLSGRGFTICLITINVLLLFVLSLGVKRQFGDAACIGTAFLAVVLCSTNDYFLEMLRPGYHTTGSLLALNWVVWRFLTAETFSIADVAFLAPLAFGSRLFLPVLLAPCFFTLLVAPGRANRIRAIMHIVAPSIVAVLLWTLLMRAPNVYVVIFDQTLHIKELLRLPLDFATGASNQSSRLSVRLPTFYWMVNLIGLAIAVRTSIRTLRLRRNSTTSPPTASTPSAGTSSAGASSANSTPLLRLNFLFALSLVLGTASMRAVDYVAKGRIYVLMFPITLGCVVVGSNLGLALDRRRSVGYTNTLNRLHGRNGPLVRQTRPPVRTALVAMMGFAVLSGSINCAALASEPTPYPYDEVPRLLLEARLLDKPGLGNFWTAYSLATTNRGVTIRMISNDGGPRNWVNNPWDLFRVPGTSTIDPDLKYYWILAMEQPGDSGGPTRLRPSLQEVSEMFGQPTKTITGSRKTVYGKPVLYVFADGLDMTKFRRAWLSSLTDRGIGTNTV